jgi:hypothetical protein
VRDHDLFSHKATNSMELNPFLKSHTSLSYSLFFQHLTEPLPTMVTARSKAWPVFARSNAGIVGSNPTQGMDVCVCAFVLCLCCPVYR